MSQLRGGAKGVHSMDTLRQRHGNSHNGGVAGIAVTADYVTVNATVLLSPPPGVGVNTVTLKLPAAAKSALRR